MSDYMPKCNVCSHYNSCTVQKALKMLYEERFNRSRELAGRKDGFVDGKYNKDITSFSIHEIVSPKFTEGQIKTDKTKRIHNYGIPEQSHKLTVNESGIVKFSEKGADNE